MGIPLGTRLGPYEITAQIGAGGMGEVYRATDTNLARQVAVKVLPESVAADPERLARFDREAKALAALNHPNIAQIYGLERTGGTVALVMELVEGPTLADVIAGRSEDRPLRTEGEDFSEDRRGRPSGRPGAGLPVDEALSIAKQIAEALEAAHEQGIIHRDLKPANVKVRPDGTVKVLDFGLAKAMEPAGAALSPGLSQSPTITTPAMTQAGMILGTAAYMSPEQARGKPVDKRTDIWAFGCVLYEMLTGSRAFGGDETADVLARVLEREPDLTFIASSVPPSIRQLLRRCLQKDPRNRLRDIGDARLELTGSSDGHEVSPAPVRAPRAREWVIAAVVGAVVVGGLVAWGMGRPAAPAPAPTMRFSLALPGGWVTLEPAFGAAGLVDPVMPFAVSPDGLTVAIVGLNDAGTRLLFVRALDALEARPLGGTEGATSPFWSPDGASLGFFADGLLKRIEIDGGPPTTVCDAPGLALGHRGTWGPDGTILLAAQGQGLQQVSASGGVAIEVTRLEAGESAHVWPQFLPDGRHVLYTATRENGRDVYVGELGSTERVQLDLGPTPLNVSFARGYLLFVRGTRLMAQAFDESSLDMVGEAVPLVEDVRRYLTGGGLVASFAAGASGALVYGAGAGQRTELVWLDRSGRELRNLSSDEEGRYEFVSLSPDGSRAAVALGDGFGFEGHVFVYDAAGGRPMQLTSGAETASTPVWSPDGDVIAFRRAGGLFQRAATGSGNETPLLTGPAINRFAYDWSRGGVLLFNSGSTTPETGADIWAWTADGEREPQLFRQTAAAEFGPRFSPGGRWIAYVSQEAGRNEVVVEPYPGPGGRWQVSAGGGSWPRWRQDGRELFFLTPDDRVMAAAVNGASSRFEVGGIETLFQVRTGGARAPFDVSADGQRFLVSRVASTTASGEVTLVLNALEELARRDVAN